MKMLDKCMILCSAGNPKERLEQLGLLNSMKRVMFGDRMFNRAKKMEFVLIDSTSREKEEREANWDSNLKKAYDKGLTLFSETEESFSLDDRFFTAVENSDTGEVSDKTGYKTDSPELYCPHTPRDMRQPDTRSAGMYKS